MMSRRGMMLCLLTLVAAPAGVRAQGRIEVWRDAGCGCCGGWIAHLREGGFAVTDNKVRDLEQARRMLGLPDDLRSCHVARLDGYLIEGHVPGAALRRLLAERPPRLRGVAVPGMPVGSPGMEVPGQADEIYDVIAFGEGSERWPFMRFRGLRPA
ncbi:MAG: DUF411 domain-containing protein [Alphaproteobacteria bacterium]|nr:DUF411 domain-containing protein [Alphaproteobacteria bacterium]